MIVDTLLALLDEYLNIPDVTYVKPRRVHIDDDGAFALTTASIHCNVPTIINIAMTNDSITVGSEIFYHHDPRCFEECHRYLRSIMLRYVASATTSSGNYTNTTTTSSVDSTCAYFDYEVTST